MASSSTESPNISELSSSSAVDDRKSVSPSPPQESQNSCSNSMFCKLPDEILGRVLEYGISIQEISRLRLTCRDVRNQLNRIGFSRLTFSVFRNNSPKAKSSAMNEFLGHKNIRSFYNTEGHSMVTIAIANYDEDHEVFDWRIRHTQDHVFQTYDIRFVEKCLINVFCDIQLKLLQIHTPGTSTFLPPGLKRETESENRINEALINVVEEQGGFAPPVELFLFPSNNRVEMEEIEKNIAKKIENKELFPPLVTGRIGTKGLQFALYPIVEACEVYARNHFGNVGGESSESEDEEESFGDEEGT